MNLWIILFLDLILVKWVYSVCELLNTYDVCPFLHVTYYDPMDCTHQAPLSMGFFRQEYWSGLPFPSPGDLPDPGIKPGSPALQADFLPTELQGKPGTRVCLR